MISVAYALSAPTVAMMVITTYTNRHEERSPWDKNTHMLLDCERSGIDTDSKDLPVRDILCPRHTDWECEKLCHNLRSGRSEYAAEGCKFNVLLG